MEFNCLIIDDNQDFCEILETTLNSTAKFRSIISAYDGLDGMRKLSNQRFDLILLDCNMPKADGLTVSKNIGNNKLDNIIIMSGDLNANVTKSFLTIGVKNMLVKPFDETLLLGKISKILKTNLVTY